MKKTFSILSIFAMFLFGCKQAPNKANEQLTIVCTTGMIADGVSNIIGSQAEVIALMGPGVDPHLYKATQGDLKKLNQADVIIYNGLHLEGKMGEIFEKLAKRKTILKAEDAISKEDLLKSTDYAGASDPHLWFDVRLWADVIAYFGNELEKIETINKDSLTAKVLSYTNNLKELDEWVFQEISSIDSNRRVLITAHDAFGYFGEAYQIKVRGLQGISTVSEYGLKDVSDLVEFIVNNNIKAVFVESSVSDRALKAVVEGCKSKGHPLTIGGTLFSDAMGEAETEAGTYMGMVKHNVNTITKGLK